MKALAPPLGSPVPPARPVPTSGSPSIHRYFELADSFVEIRVVESEAVELAAPRCLDRVSYRRFVIQTCMPQFSCEVLDQLEQLFPEDPLLAEDMLYELCVEVNPNLEIHSVRLRELNAPRPEPAAPRRERKPTRDDGLDRLARVWRNLERRLLKRIHGQTAAVGNLCRAVHKAAAGLNDPIRPRGCFLFVGRTGTGKTELARSLARELSEDRRTHGNQNLIRIDCSEYALAHEYSKLIGSPPGYVGHDEGGQLTKALAEHPDAVVLFDEIEKAHPRMHNILLQIMEEGALTDGRGNRARLDRNFVILTSNAGAEDIRSASNTVGFHHAEGLGEETLRAITEQALQQQFSPEFIGRLDEIVLFRELDLGSVRQIAQDQLTELAIRARRRGAKVSFTPAVARWVADRGFSTALGARELRQVIQKEIEPPLAELLLRGEVTADQLVRARIRGGELVFTVEE